MTKQLKDLVLEQIKHHITTNEYYEVKNILEDYEDLLKDYNDLKYKLKEWE